MRRIPRFNLVELASRTRGLLLIVLYPIEARTEVEGRLHHDSAVNYGA
ncbi:hypothetical protein [Sphingomonas xanthus]|nr:hypothetical protein [Sphingomonas xanthus]